MSSNVGKKRKSSDIQNLTASKKKKRPHQADETGTSENGTGAANEIKYHIVPGSSIKHKDKMFDSVGYTYHRKMTYSNRNGEVQGFYWRCSLTISAKCPATIYQLKDTMQCRLLNAHSHIAIEGIVGTSSEAIRKEAQIIINENPNSTLSELTELSWSKFGNKYPVKYKNLKRIIDRLVKQRPAINVMHNFNGAMYPNVVIEDLYKTDTERSLLVTTKAYTKLLCCSSFLKIGLSTESVCHPYTAAIVLQAYCKDSKQDIVKVNLAYIFMTEVNKNIVKKTMQNLEMLSSLEKTVEMVVHPDPIIWSVIHEIYPRTTLKCDYYQWKLAVDRSIKSFSLNADLPVIKKLRCLNLIPALEITNLIINLQQKLTEHRSDEDYKNVKRFYKHMYKNWIDNENFQPINWSAYNGDIDPAGHDYFDSEVKEFLEIVERLKRTDLKLTIIEDINVIKDSFKNNNNKIKKKLHKLWKKYKTNKITLEELFNNLSAITGLLEEIKLGNFNSLEG